MMKKSTQINFILFSTLLPLSTAVSMAWAAPAVSSPTSEKMLEEMTNAESARIAELNVKLNHELGIIHTLQKHSAGNDVKLLQQFLKVYGVYPKGLITGYFGSLTEQAVKRFQEKESIDPIGIAGPKTRARITEISKQKTEGFQKTPFSLSRTATTPSSSTFPTPTIITRNDVPEITHAVLVTEIAENGDALSSVTSFASTTQNIYAVLSFKNATQETQIGYIRYYENAYIDSKVSHPSRGNLKYSHFQWSLKPGINRSIGNYSITFYLDGKKAKTLHYTIY